MTVVEAPNEVSVEGQLAELAGVLNCSHARAVRVVAQAVVDGGWFGEGIHTVEHWLTIHLGVSPHHAHQIATIARRADDFPVLLAAFERGELSLDQTYEVAHRAPAWADVRMTEFASVCTVAQLRRTIRAERFEGDPDAPPPETAKPVSGTVSVGWDDNDHLKVNATLDAEHGMVVQAALDEARDALFGDGHTDVTWADALAEVAQRSLDTVSAERRDRYRINVHLETSTGKITLGNGVNLPQSLADYVACDADLRPVWMRDNKPFGVGRTRRAIPRRTRTIIEHRDQGCGVPGCRSRHVEIHHIVHWNKGGTTDPDNLISLCARHHRLHHQGLLHITGNPNIPGDVVFTDANGRELATHPQPRVPSEPPPPPATRYQHPSGERLQPKWVGDWAHPNALAARRQRNREHHDRQRNR